MVMVLSQYSRGRAKEYKVMTILRKTGWLVTRSAASHGPVDIIAAREGKVLLIQVKSGKARIRKEELSELIRWGRNFGSDVEVWHFRGRGKIERRRIYSSGEVN
jgi:Holliday junction resolvase